MDLSLLPRLAQHTPTRSLISGQATVASQSACSQLRHTPFLQCHRTARYDVLHIDKSTLPASSWARGVQICFTSIVAHRKCAARGQGTHPLRAGLFQAHVTACFVSGRDGLRRYLLDGVFSFVGIFAYPITIFWIGFEFLHFSAALWSSDPGGSLRVLMASWPCSSRDGKSCLVHGKGDSGAWANSEGHVCCIGRVDCVYDYFLLFVPGPASLALRCLMY